MVGERDEPWDHAALLKEVTSEVQEEREGKVPGMESGSVLPASAAPTVPPFAVTVGSSGAPGSGHHPSSSSGPQFTQTMAGAFR
jgi:hypothetical protein